MNIDINELTRTLPNYLDRDYIGKLHSDAFRDVLDVLAEFIQKSTEVENNDYLSWVCNAVMGSGKSTAIEVLLKYLGDMRINTPILLVFAEKNLMKRIYDSVNIYGREKGNNFLIDFVDSENVQLVQHTLNQYQFVCITQQRYRDLILGYGNWSDYKYYKYGHNGFHKTIERLTIVDEMPILFDSCVFDPASRDNSVDWFDILAEESELSASEKQFGRTMITNLISYEMLKSEGISVILM